jgi:hypothetical protein
LVYLQELKIVSIHGVNHVLEKEVNNGIKEIRKKLIKKVVKDLKIEEIG